MCIALKACCVTVALFAFWFSFLHLFHTCTPTVDRTTLFTFFYNTISPSFPLTSPLSVVIYLHHHTTFDFNDRLTELKFYIPFNTKLVISETPFPVDLFTSTEKTKSKLGETTTNIYNKSSLTQINTFRTT